MEVQVLSAAPDDNSVALSKAHKGRDVAELINVRVLNTGEEYVISDVEPVESAKLFLRISDEIWKQRPKRLMLTYFNLPSVMSAPENCV